LSNGYRPGCLRYRVTIAVIVNLRLHKAQSYRASLAPLAGAFLFWGLLRSLDDVLVALFNASGLVHYSTAMLIHLSFFSSYLIMSIPAGIFLRRYGYRTSLIASLMLMAAGTTVCVSAAMIDSFALCLAGIFVMALGIAALQTSANPCIGMLGPERTAASRLLVVQGFSSLGSMIGPLAGIALFGNWSQHRSLAPLLFPRRLLATVYLLLAICVIALVFLLRRYFVETSRPIAGPETGTDWMMLRHRRLLFGGIATFLYVGCEVTLLGHSIPYLSHQYSEGFLPGTAAALLSLYWASVLGGRICAVSLLRRIDTRTLLQASCAIAFLLIQAAVHINHTLGAICLLSTGFCNATMFPSIFSLSVAGMREEDLPHASALLSTAICGGAVMPFLSGLLADHLGISAAFLLPSAAYAFIGLCSGSFFSRTYHLKRIHVAEPA
jgi:MFS transporter, FHS family, L-fucose permease